MPQVSEVGLAQLVMMLPRARPGGTRSDAMAPAIVPRKNGVMTEENANAAPNRRRCQSSVTALQNDDADPRAMTPTASRVSVLKSVEATAENRGGNAVQTTTRTKISQTWLAS